MAKKDKPTNFSDSNYTLKSMNEFTMMDSDELQNMEQIMAMVKANMKAKAENASK